jgi:signal transduction histidine kinase
MEPFFTTKEANIGLGMAIAYKIIRDHGGELKINSSPDTGTIVEVILPLPVVESEEKLA